MFTGLHVASVFKCYNYMSQVTVPTWLVPTSVCVDTSLWNCPLKIENKNGFLWQAYKKYTDSFPKHHNTVLRVLSISTFIYSNDMKTSKIRLSTPLMGYPNLSTRIWHKLNSRTQLRWQCTAACWMQAFRICGMYFLFSFFCIFSITVRDVGWKSSYYDVEHCDVYGIAFVKCVVWSYVTMPIVGHYCVNLN